MSMLETLHVNGASLAAGCTRAVVHILETSWQAAILVAVVVLLTLLLRERLAARWRSALWLVVVVRLLMPFTPESPVSLFNFLPIEVTWNTEAKLPTEPTLVEATPVDEFVPGGTYAMDVAAIPVELPSYSPGYAMPETPAVSSLPELLEPIAPDTNDRDTAWSTAQIVWLSVISVWFLGIAVLLLRVCFLMVRLHFLLKGCLSITTSSRTRGRSLKSGSAAEILEIFEAARRELRIRRLVELLASPQSVGPAVTGIFRPKLILAESLLDTLSHDELRLVFLHELSHIRRQDLFAQRLWQIAEIVHWFNPVVWLAARRWQTDRELACDEAVLARLDHSHRANYGHAILRVMESLSTLRPVPGAVGVLMRRGFLTSRITKIATYRPLSRRWTALAVGLLLLLIPIGLTNAVGDSKQPAEPEEVAAVADEKVTTDESSRPDRDPALEKSDQTEKPDRADGAEVEVEPVDVEKDALPIPAQTITSSLRMVISTEVDRGEEFTGRTPGTVEIPACKKRVFYLDALSPDSVEDYKNELKRLGVKSVSLRGTVTDAQLKGYLDSGLFDEVISLELDGQDLTDLSFFSNLTQLRSLTFRFSDKLVDPSSLSKLKRLESLHLYSCPNLKDLSCLSELKDLESLRLEFCSNLTDISALAKLVDLKTLILSSCEKVKDFSAISKLKNLASLDVSYGEFSDVSLLSELKELKAFSMLGCLKVKLKEGAVLPNCKNLRSLKLHADSLSDLSTLSKCKNLKALEVHFSAEATATDSDFLSGLPGLAELIISGSEKLTGLSAISDLENLTTLQLFVHKQIDNSVHWDLKNLKAKNLKTLYLTLPQNVTDLSFLSNFKGLEQLSLMGAYETLTDFSAIADLKNLTRLELAACYCTDLDFVSDLEKLQFVNGQLCLKLTDISAVSKNENLKACTFCGCPELVTGVSDLVKLKKLQAISFVACPKVKPEDIELLLEQFSDDVVDYQPDVEMPPMNLKSSTEETEQVSETKVGDDTESGRPDRDPALEKSDQPQKPDSDRADGAEAESNLTDVEKTTTVTCRCVDENDQPIAGANVAVVGLNGMPAAPEVLDETITDAEGCYRINLTDMALASHNNFYVIARVSGKGLAWQRLELDAKQNDLLVRFIEEVPIRGQLVDLHGKPIAGMRITCGRIESSRIVPFIFNGFMPGPGQNQNPPKAWLQPVTTDEEGRFVIHNLPPEIGVSLDVEGNDKFAPKNVRVNCSNLSKTQGAYCEQITNIKAGEEVAVTLPPATIFEGVVRYGDTGQPVPHAQIKIWADQRQFNAFNSPSYAWVCGQADAQGRYRIVAKPGNQFGIQAYPPQGVPYLAKKTDPINWQGGRTEPKVKQVDVMLPRGILVRGIVVDSKSKQPIPRVWIKHELDDAYNDRAADPDFYFSHFWNLQLSGKDGRFEIVVPPGAGCLLASSTRGDFASRPFAPVPNDDDYLPVADVRCAHACRKIAPKADEKSIEVTMQLERGEKVVGRITDEKGELIDRACMRTQMNFGGIQPLIGGAHGTQILSDGHFELTGLAKGEEYYALFRDTKGRGAVASIKASEKPTIVLKPCGAVTATCVNENGQPVPFFTPPLYAIAPSHSHSYGYDRRCPQVDKKTSNQPPYPKTDEEGNITFPDLIPDATYCIYGKSGRPWEEKKKFTVKPGEMLNLGKIVFRSETVKTSDPQQAQPFVPPSSTPATPWPPKSKEDTHPLASPESKQANPIAYTPVRPPLSIPAQTVTSSLSMGITTVELGKPIFVGKTPGMVEIPACEDRCFVLNGLNLENVEDYKKEIRRIGTRRVCLPANMTNTQLKKCQESGILDGVVLLQIPATDDLDDLACLSKLKNLKSLKLGCESSLDRPGGLTKLKDLSALSAMKGLTSLKIQGCVNLENISALEASSDLTSLQIMNCGDKIKDHSVLTKLTQLETLWVFSGRDITDLSFLREFKKLKSFAWDARDMSEVSVLGELEDLEHLVLFVPPKANNAAFLANHKNLKTLVLFGSPSLTDLSSVAKLSNLAYFELNDAGISDFSFLADHNELTEIWARRLPALKDISFLSGLKNLKKLHMDRCPNVQPSDVQQLREQLPGCKIKYDEVKEDNEAKATSDSSDTDEKLSPFSTRVMHDSVRVEPVTIGWGYPFFVGESVSGEKVQAYKEQYFALPDLNPYNIDDYSKELKRRGIRNIRLNPYLDVQLQKCYEAGLFTGITTLCLTSYDSLTDLSCVSELQGLKSLTLEFLPNLTDLSLLTKLQGLTSFRVTDCAQLRDISAISRLPNLKQLDLSHCDNLTDISALARMESLEILQLRCDKLDSEDLSCLSKMKNLKSLKLESFALDRPGQDLSFLSSLKDLETLEVEIPLYVTNASFLSGMKKLKRLYIYKAGKLTDLSAIAGLKELERFTVCSCSATTLNFRPEQEQLVQVLVADCPNLTDISSISQCKNLRLLKLVPPHKIKPEDIQQLQKQLPNCQIGYREPKNSPGETEMAKEKTTVITGRCVDENGQPIFGAYVTAIGRKIDPYHGGGRPDSPVEFLAGTKTSRNGSYRIYLPDVSSKSYRNTAVIARADGTGLAWKNFNPDERSVNSTLILLKEESIRGRLLDKQGNPADGVRLTLSSVMAERSKSGALGPYLELGLEDRVCRQLPDRLPQPITTDEKGQFTVHGVAPGHGFSLDVEGGDRFAPQTLVINSGRPEEREKYDGTYRPQIKNFKPGEEVVMTLLPSQIIEGVVRYEDTGKPAAHARLEIWTSQQERGGTLTPTVGQADALGRYRISAKPGVRSYVIAYPSGGVPYLAKKSDDVLWESDSRTKQIDVTLPRGVLVRGKVIDSESKQPIVGTSIRYLPKSNNPNRKERSMGDGGWEANRLSDENGQFEIAVLPGPGSLLAHGPGEEFVRQETGSNQIYKDRPGGNRYYLNAIEPISPKQDAETVDVTLVLKRGEKVRGRVVNEKGEPVEEAILSSHLIIHPGMIRWYGDFFQKASDGRFELSGLDPGKEYPVYFLDQKNRLGATAMIKAGDTPTIVLKPCGQANVTFADDKGQPLSDLYYSLEMLVTPGVDMFSFASAEQDKLIADATLVMSFDRINYPSRPQIDEQGHTTFLALIPGATYRLGCQGAKGRTNKEFTVKPGETLELGEIVVDELTQPGDKVPPPKAEVKIDVANSSPAKENQTGKTTIHVKAIGGESGIEGTITLDAATFPDDKNESITVGNDKSTITGRCVDEKGEPISGAYVAAIGRNWAVPEEELAEVFAETTTDNDGNFQFKLTDVLQKCYSMNMIIARAEGMGMAVESFDPQVDSEGHLLTLAKEKLIRGRLIDKQDKPVAGVRLRYDSLYTLVSGVGPKGVEIFNYSSTAHGVSLPCQFQNPPKAWPEPIVTDQQGRFVVTGCPQGPTTNKMLPQKIVHLAFEGNEHFAPQRLGIFWDASWRKSISYEHEPFKYIEDGEEAVLTFARVEVIEKISSVDNSAKTITISGRCVDKKGEPISGAYVAAIGRDNNVLSTPGFTVLGEAVADHDGRYELKLTGVSPKSHRTTYVLVRAEGKGVAWESFVPNADVVKVPVVLKDEVLIHCRLVDPQGNPIAGMPIECPFVRNTMLNDGYSNGMGSIESEKPIKAWLPAINTDAEGRFVVANVAQGYGAMLRIKGNDQFAPRELLINFEDSKEVGKTNRETSPSVYLETQPGEEKTVTLTPGCVFQGVVSCEDTGKPIPHARLKICGSKEKFSGSDVPIECETDAEGRYRALVTPRPWFRVEVYPPRGVPYLARVVRNISLPEEVWSKQVDVALPRGVLLYGKVIEKKTDKPISGAAIQYIPETSNLASSILTGWQVIQRSDDKGQFKIVVLPGSGRLLAHGPHDAFVLNVTSTGELFHGVPGGRRRYANAILPIDPRPMAKPFGVTLWMERGEKVVGLVTNEEGEPADARIFTRLAVNPYLNEWNAYSGKSCSGGQFEFADLAKGEEYPVHFLDRKKRLGATVVVKAGDKPTVVLRPCGQATATFVNQHGQPIAGHTSTLDIIITPSKHLYNAEVLIGELEADRDYVSNTDATNHRPTPTSDAQGRVTFPALIPGATYCVYGNDGSGWGSVKKEFTVKSGETLDLGEILLHQKDALPKKKTSVPEVENVKKAKIASPPTMGLDKVDWSVPRKIER